MGRRDHLLDLAGQLLRAGHRPGPDQRGQREQRRPALEHLPPLEEQRAQHFLQVVQPAAALQLPGEVRRRPRDLLPQQGGGQPDAEDPEPVQQPLPVGGGDAELGPALQEPVGGQQQLLDLGRCQLADPAKMPDLGLGQGGRGLGEQPGDRQHRLHQPPHLGVAGQPGGDPSGRGHRLQPPDADLVGAGQHADRVDRVRPRHLGVVEGAQELHVVAVQMFHQVQDGVGGGLLVVHREQVPGAPGQALRQRPDARGVDERRAAQRPRGPGDHELIDLIGGQAAEVDLEDAVVAGEAGLAGRAVERVDVDPVGVAVGEPGDDPGALPGVGRRQALPDEGVEQRGLAGLHPPGDGHPQRLVQAVEDAAQAGLGVAAAVDLDGVPERGAGVIDQEVHRRHPRTVAARERRARNRSSSAPTSFNRAARSASPRCAVSLACCRAWALDRLSSSARAV